MKPREVIEVSAALIFRRSHLLITQRPQGVHLAGFWEFPGGKLERNESFELCLAREIREELDCDIHVGECIYKTVHAYPEKTVDIRFFCCRLAGIAEPRGLACKDLRWVTRDSINTFTFPEADAKLLDYLLEHPDMWH
ncbi:MAG: (deoxy)nucleoside triphosphate pyrophosphohydrolase [Verrucomicrobiota bacterium]|nr:(deoxy)nucleoside triphosphate pyrophosphohydrolase [Verrucomicrobiota bacterium]